MGGCDNLPVDRGCIMKTAIFSYPLSVIKLEFTCTVLLFFLSVVTRSRLVAIMSLMYYTLQFSINLFYYLPRFSSVPRYLKALRGIALLTIFLYVLTGWLVLLSIIHGNL